MSTQKFGFASNGQLGATGNNQMAAQSSLKTKLGGLEVSRYISWANRLGSCPEVVQYCMVKAIQRLEMGRGRSGVLNGQQLQEMI